jgi:hypothetical protein
MLPSLRGIWRTAALAMALQKERARFEGQGSVRA